MANWNVKLYDYDADNNLGFTGYNKDLNAKESDDGWYIKKMTYDGVEIIRIEKMIGVWNDRGTLGWR